MKKVTLLLGAEGCAEADDQPWLRDATDEEVADFKDRNPGLSSIDHTSRPYFYKTFTEDAPEEILKKASTLARSVRL